MNDWELFNAMNEAEKRFDELQKEFRARGLHNKPFVEYSRAQQSVQSDGDAPRCEGCGTVPIMFSKYCHVCRRPRR